VQGCLQHVLNLFDCCELASMIYKVFSPVLQERLLVSEFCVFNQASAAKCSGISIKISSAAGVINFN